VHVRDVVDGPHDDPHPDAVGTLDESFDEDISPELRAVVQRQLTEIRAARDDVKTLRTTLS